MLSLSILGIILSVVLLRYNARRYTSSVFLGIFFFLMSLYGIIQYILFFSESVPLVAITFTNAGFPTYLIGPAFYIYIRSVLNDTTRLRKRDLLHLLPMLIYLAGSYDYFFSSWTFKTEIATRIIESGFQLQFLKADLGWMYQKFPLLLIYLSRPLLLLVYLLWSVLKLIRFILEGRRSTVPGKQQFMIQWLWVLSGFLFIFTVSHTLQIIVSFEVRDILIFKTLNVLHMISILGLSGLLISPFFFPHILYGLPRFPKSIVEQEEKNIGPGSDPVIQKAIPTKFEENYIDLIGQKTERCMAGNQPYLNRDFNMIQLSVLINIPVHHLTWYFREIKKRSFTDFRNELRIRHAQVLIKEGRTNGMTLEAIGMMSGFLSRNAFLTAFKKVEGLTPSEYMNRFKH